MWPGSIIHLKDIPRTGTAKSYVHSVLNFTWNGQTISPSASPTRHPHQRCVSVPIPSHPPLCPASCLSSALLMSISQDLILTLICLSLLGNDVLSVGLFAICISSLWIVFSSLLSILKLGCLFFESSDVLDISPRLDTCFVSIFSYSVACLLIH